MLVQLHKDFMMDKPVMVMKNSTIITKRLTALSSSIYLWSTCSNETAHPHQTTNFLSLVHERLVVISIFPRKTLHTRTPGKAWSLTRHSPLFTACIFIFIADDIHQAQEPYAHVLRLQYSFGTHTQQRIGVHSGQRRD